MRLSLRDVDRVIGRWRFRTIASGLQAGKQQPQAGDVGVPPLPPRLAGLGTHQSIESAPGVQLALP